MIKKFHFYFLPFISGFLIGTSYIPFPPWAIFFCYTPLWFFALKQKQLKSILTGAWLCQLIATLIGFSWVAYTIKEFEFFSWPWAILGFVVFSSFANLHIPIALLIWFISQKKLNKIKNSLAHSLFIPLLLPIYFALSMEYCPMIFDWHFGYTWLYAKWPAAQTAEIWGFQFLNTLTLFFNLLFLFVFKHLKKEAQTDKFLSLFKSKKQALWTSQLQLLLFLLKIITSKNILIPLILWAVPFLGLNFYGQYLKNRWPEPDQKVRVLIVQPNIENQIQGKEKWNDFILSKLLQETMKNFNSFPEKNHGNTASGEAKNKQAGDSFSSENKKEPEKKMKGQTDLSIAKTKKETSDGPVDFILWPEGAYPYPINTGQASINEDPVQKWASVFNTPLVVSAEGQNLQKYTSSVFVFDQNGRLVKGPYDKIVLMPFGEYVPLEKWFPPISRFLFGDITFYPGSGTNKVISLNGLNLGFQICYESLFDWLTRSVAREGADILINVTNDAWFGKWQEPWQHLYMTLSRAIEVRRPLIRGTNSGFSAVISAKGDIFSPGILGEKLSWIEKVPYSKMNKKQSLFVSWGYYINQIFLWISLILIHLLPLSGMLKEPRL